MSSRSKLFKATSERSRGGLKKYNNNGIPTMESQVKAPIPQESDLAHPDTITPKERTEIEKGRVNRAQELPELAIIASAIEVYSEDEIQRMSVVDVVNPNISDLANPAPGSLYDANMNSIFIDRKCTSCFQVDCHGHYGRIPFPYPIPHPLWMAIILKILKCICGSCGSLLMSKEEIKTSMNFTKRLDSIAEKSVNLRCKGHKTCPDMGVSACKPNPKYTLPPVPKNREDNASFEIIREIMIAPKKFVTEDFPMPMVLALFKCITDEDARAMGMGINVRPENYIMRSMLVSPPNSRDVFTTAAGYNNHDDMTNNYNEIVKAANKLRNNTDPKLTNGLRYALFSKVQFFYFGSKSKTATYKKTSLKDQLQGKKGKPRQILMGKRVNSCARSVAGINTLLRFDQIGVPSVWAPLLTQKETVTDWNLENLKALQEQGKLVSVEHKNMNGSSYRIPVNEKTFLKVGDVVYRHLMNGDIIPFNRQPSLHKYSLQAAEVLLHPGLNIQFHISVTPGLNLDFDGDEVNLWATVFVEAMIEANQLLHVKHNIMSSAKNRPITGLVYDAITSSYMISNEKEIDEAFYYEIMDIITNGDDLISLNDRLEMYNVPRRSGRGVYSMIFPEDLNYTRGSVSIRNGVLLEGTLTSADIGPGGGVITEIVMKYGPDRTVQFITDASFMVLHYITERGLSVGISDCMAINTEENKKEKDEKDKIFKSVQSEIAALGPKPEDPLDAKIYEESVSNIIRAGDEKIFKVLKKRISEKSNMMGVMGKETGAGAKGEPFNQRQISGSVGQQYLRGERVKAGCGKRLLLAYDKEETDIRAGGYIKSSFMEGLTAEEHFVLVMAGREGLVDTAVNVPTIGDIHRKITKSLENVLIGFSGAVVNADNATFQLIYGGDGFDPAKLRMVKTTGSDTKIPSFVDLHGLANELNTKMGWVYVNKKWEKNIRKIGEEKVLDDQRPVYLTQKNVLYIVEDFPRVFCDDKDAEEVARKSIVKRLVRDLSYVELSPAMISEMKTEIHEAFSRAQVSIGEPVGILAAEANGEGATQITLNTFHFSGSATNAISGIDALKSLLYAFKNTRNRSSTIILKNPPADFNGAISYINKLEGISIGDLTDNGLTFVDDFHNMGRPYWYDEFIALTGAPEPVNTKVLRLTMKTHKMMLYDITMKEIADYIDSVSFVPKEDGKIVSVYYSALFDRTIDIHLTTDRPDVLISKNPDIQTLADISFLKNVVVSKLNNKYVRGIPTIRKIFPASVHVWERSVLLSRHPYPEEYDNFLDSLEEESREGIENDNLWYIEFNIPSMEMFGITTDIFDSLIESLNLTIYRYENGEVYIYNPYSKEDIVSFVRSRKDGVSYVISSEHYLKSATIPFFIKSGFIREEEEGFYIHHPTNMDYVDSKYKMIMWMYNTIHGKPAFFPVKVAPEEYEENEINRYHPQEMRIVGFRLKKRYGDKAKILKKRTYLVEEKDGDYYMFFKVYEGDDYAEKLRNKGYNIKFDDERKYYSYTEITTRRVEYSSEKLSSKEREKRGLETGHSVTAYKLELPEGIDLETEEDVEKDLSETLVIEKDKAFFLEFEKEVYIFYSDANADELSVLIQKLDIRTSKNSRSFYAYLENEKTVFIEEMPNKRHVEITGVKLRLPKGIAMKNIVEKFKESSKASPYDYWYISTSDVELKGYSLLDILNSEFVNELKTYNNDVKEITELLGVEAGYSFFIRSLKELSAKSYMDPRHILLVADFIFSLGRPHGILYAGLSKHPIGHLSLINFERAMEALKNLAPMGNVESTSNVSAALSTGQYTKGGTGMFNFINSDNVRDALERGPETASVDEFDTLLDDISNGKDDEVPEIVRRPRKVPRVEKKLKIEEIISQVNSEESFVSYKAIKEGFLPLRKVKIRRMDAPADVLAILDGTFVRKSIEEVRKISETTGRITGEPVLIGVPSSSKNGRQRAKIIDLDNLEKDLNEPEEEIEKAKEPRKPVRRKARLIDLDKLEEIL